MRVERKTKKRIYVKRESVRGNIGWKKIGCPKEKKKKRTFQASTCSVFFFVFFSGFFALLGKIINNMGGHLKVRNIFSSGEYGIFP